MTETRRGRPHRLCPVWVGYLLTCPVRTFVHNPDKILSPHVRSGMHILEVGPGMGFFTLPLARLNGATGRVVCVDVQEKMLRALMRRARRAGLADRIETRVCAPDSLNVADLSRTIDFVLAFAVVHEVADAAALFKEVQGILKPGGRVLLAEPKSCVSEQAFSETLSTAELNGLFKVESRRIAGSRGALLENAKTQTRD